MHASKLYRVRMAMAAALAAIPAGFAAADPPVPPASAVAPAGASPSPEVELYYGTVQVAPKTAPAADSAASPNVADPHVRAAVVDSLNAVRDGARKVSSAVATYLAKTEERSKPSTEAPGIVLASATQPASQPQPLPGTISTTPVGTQPPTVVVIRESGQDVQRAAPSPGGVTLGWGTLVGFGVGMLGLGAALVAWRRRPLAFVPPTVTTAPVMSENGVLLMGKYNAGPRQETAERFELGASYQAEQEEKEQAEAAKQDALVEHILTQNLALLSE